VPRRSPLLVALALVAAALAGCSTGSSTSTADGRLAVVAAESFWGSLARQLGGDRVTVTSLISSPDIDPHDYEPTPADARAIASAGYVVANGIGYDAWVDKLASANAAKGRGVLRVGDLVGAHDGDNPHQWYSPGVVDRVVTQITADYKRLRPADAPYFDEQGSSLRTEGLAEYHRLIADIRSRYAGQPVGASESIVVPLAEALGLRLVTPGTFLDAISEGNEPTAADKATVDAQIEMQAMRVFVFNSQNSTPDVQRLVDAATARGIPVATLTETLTPPDATFQAWQTAQLHRLELALAAGK
jgi:zinc/manganese transport system substrate-binding protein